MEETNEEVWKLQAQRRQARLRRIKRKRRLRILKRILAAILLLIAVYIGISWFNRYSIDHMRDSGEYPESLLALAERNPETKQFVRDYPKNKDRQDEIDVSGEVKEGEIPLFLQWDERWGYQIYGDDFMAVTGCGPTCLSMVYCGLTGNADWNPLAVAKKADQKGYYVAGSGSSWSIMTDIAGELGLSASEISLSETSIRSELEAGHPIICIVGPGDFTNGGHFIVLTGVDDKGNFIIKDPNSKKNSSKVWDPERVMGQIRNLWSYSN